MPTHLPQMYVTFLGTSSAWPTVARNVSSTAVKWGSELILFDCGEGTQRQLQRSDLSYMSTRRIFLTHLHGDHHYGLPGLIKTMALNEREEPLDVYGPPGTADLMDAYARIAPVREEFRIEVHELRDREKVETGGYTVTARRLNHGAFNLGYALSEPSRPGRFDKPKALSLGVPEGPLFRDLQQGKSVKLANGTTVRSEDVLGPSRKGRTVVVSGDTAPCPALIELARGADLLICEATYCKDMLEKAAEFGHMTAESAAQAAREAGVSRLVLTHLSPRYTDAGQHLAEARPIYPSVEVAQDLQSVEVRLVE